MALLEMILVFTFIGSVAGLAGGLLLLWKQKIAKKASILMVSFAAGALAGTTFLELFPEALKIGIDPVVGFTWSLAAIVIFFIMEKFFVWHHHHSSQTRKHPLAYLVTFGDAVHNFVDGIIIAASFLVDVKLGIITAVAVFFHEIPQEIGDFGVLLHVGLSRSRIILYNFLSALAAFVGALGLLFFSNQVQSILPFLLTFAGGIFIYIANSDLIPELHKEVRVKSATIHTFLFVFGILLIWYLGVVFPE